MYANRRTCDQSAPTDPASPGASIGVGLIIGAAVGLLLLSRIVFGGDLALGVAAGAGLALSRRGIRSVLAASAEVGACRSGA
jgi:hypothetical protein